MKRIFLYVFTFIFQSVFAQTDSIPHLYLGDISVSKKGEKSVKTEVLKKFIFKDGISPVLIIFNDSIKRTGVINEKGKFLINPEYAGIGKIERNIIPLNDKRNGLDIWKLYKIGKGFLSEEFFDEYKIISSNVIFVSVSSKWGAIIDGKKKSKFIKPIYKNLELLGSNIMGQKLNSWKFFPSNDSLTLEYDSFYFFSDTLLSRYLIKVGIKNKYGLLDHEGNVIVDCLYDSIVVYIKDSIIHKELFQNKYGNTYKDSSSVGFAIDSILPEKYKIENGCELWGFKKNDSIIISPQFTYAENFKSDSALVYKDNKPGIINEKGEWLIEPGYYEMYKAGLSERDSLNKLIYFFPPEKFSQIQKISADRIIVRDNNFLGIIDSKGKTILHSDFDKIIPSESDSIFVVYKQNKFGIFDFNGDTLSALSNRFDKVYDYVEGRAKFIKLGKFGFIDRRGSTRVAPQYQQVRDFCEGAAAVIINGKWGFIDKDENILVQPFYEEVRDFKNGLARVKQGKIWFFVDKSGKRVGPTSYDEIYETDNNNWIIIKDKKKGLANQNGREQLAPRYEYLKETGDGSVIVKKDGKWGVVDYQENILIPREFDYIIYNSILKIFALMENQKEEIIDISDILSEVK